MSSARLSFQNKHVPSFFTFPKQFEGMSVRRVEVVFGEHSKTLDERESVSTAGDFEAVEN